jgi:hypothetical protein
MWDVTGWAAATWLKTTLALAVLVGGCWLALGASSGLFVLVCLGVAVAEIYVTRQLVREWTHEASLRWWYR